jgi:hypothetical protein
MLAKFESFRRWLPIVVVTACGGCNLLLDETPARDESFRQASGYDRELPETQKSLPWGVSSRSRDVERDLGVK